MYASFFGLRELPFNNTPDPRFFFSTPDHEEALASLIYSIGESKGFVLLTGEVGAGKTLVTRLMLRHFGESIAFACVNNTQITASELLQSICTEFDIQIERDLPNVAMIRTLQDFLLAQFSQNKPVVLMLDEAQALSREAFEQVRMIGNLEADDAKLLQIVIVGQPELRERFESNDMRQLRQRIFRSFHLSALTREQTQGYIHHRLGVAGAQHPNIFDSSAVDVIHEYAQGLPRLINTVCDNAMLSAYASDRTWIDEPFVSHVLSQMMTVPQGGPRYASPRVAVSPDPTAAHRTAEQPQCVETTERAFLDPAGSSLLLQLAQEVGQLRNQVMNPEPRTRSPQTAGGLGFEGALRESPSSADEANDRLNESVQRSSQAQTDLETVLEQMGQAEDAFVQRTKARLQPLVKQVKAVEDEAGRQIDVLRRQAQAVRTMLSDARTAVSDGSEMVKAVQHAKADADQALKSLRDQSTHTGKLAVTLRGIFGKLEERANRMAERPNEPEPTGGTEPIRAKSEPDHSRVTNRNQNQILEKTRTISRIIRNSRSIAEEMNDLVEAVAAARPKLPAFAGVSTELSSQTATVRRAANRLAASPDHPSRLKERVQALQAIIAESRAAR